MSTIRPRSIHAVIAVVAAGLLAIAAPAHAADEAAQQKAVNGIVKHYLAIETLLVNDKIEGLAEHRKMLHHEAHDLIDATANAKVKELAQKISKTAHDQPEDVKAARMQFKAFSEALIPLVQVASPTSDVAPVLYQANCPMAKASWLQTDKEVANPYMGQKMLRCGEVQKTIETKSPKK